MVVKSVRRLDGQGRVILPSHIRKTLNLGKDSEVIIGITRDGTITITPAEARCSVCSKKLNGTSKIRGIAIGNEEKYVCPSCYENLKEIDA